MRGYLWGIRRIRRMKLGPNTNKVLRCGSSVDTPTLTEATSISFKLLTYATYPCGSTDTPSRKTYSSVKSYSPQHGEDPRLRIFKHELQIFPPLVEVTTSFMKKEREKLNAYLSSNTKTSPGSHWIYSLHTHDSCAFVSKSMLSFPVLQMYFTSCNCSLSLVWRCSFTTTVKNT